MRQEDTSQSNSNGGSQKEQNSSTPDDRDGIDLGGAFLPPRPPPLFHPGKVFLTPGVQQLVLEGTVDLAALLTQHLQGDWGELGAEDRRVNREALKQGQRLLSAYDVPNADNATKTRVWIITEADRSATTFLLPQEY